MCLTGQWDGKEAECRLEMKCKQLITIQCHDRWVMWPALGSSLLLPGISIAFTWVVKRLKVAKVVAKPKQSRGGQGLQGSLQ